MFRIHISLDLKDECRDFFLCGVDQSLFGFLRARGWTESCDTKAELPDAAGFKSRAQKYRGAVGRPESVF
ncbi:MAG: hypothetical protein MK135_06270, partial [Polyangiaceae bacterium]|nr:hypothetical protein [Polyangiaceae bacterium]